MNSSVAQLVELNTSFAYLDGRRASLCVKLVISGRYLCARAPLFHSDTDMNCVTSPR